MKRRETARNEYMRRRALPPGRPPCRKLADGILDWRRGRIAGDAVRFRGAKDAEKTRVKAVLESGILGAGVCSLRFGLPRFSAPSVILGPRHKTGCARPHRAVVRGPDRR